jgi:hypothetical protein
LSPPGAKIERGHEAIGPARTTARHHEGVGRALWRWRLRERALTRLRAQRRETWWRPDGGLVVADVAVSGGPPLHTIEVELTPKHLAKLQQIFEHRYPGEVQTTYFTPPAHQDGLRQRLAVLEQATRARNEPWSRVNVVPLPVLPGVPYEGAA